MSVSVLSQNSPSYIRSCELADLTEVQLEIETLAADWYADDIKLNFFCLSIIEVLANVFEHSFHASQQTTNAVELSILKDQSSISAIIKDNGKEVPGDVLTVMNAGHHVMPNTEVPSDELPDSGWGLNLIQHATQMVEYRRDNHFNYLELIFDCSSDAP